MGEEPVPQYVANCVPAALAITLNLLGEDLSIPYVSDLAEKKGFFENGGGMPLVNIPPFLRYLTDGRHVGTLYINPSHVKTARTMDAKTNPSFSLVHSDDIKVHDFYQNGVSSKSFVDSLKGISRPFIANVHMGAATYHAVVVTAIDTEQVVFKESTYPDLLQFDSTRKFIDLFADELCEIQKKPTLAWV